MTGKKTGYPNSTIVERNSVKLREDVKTLLKYGESPVGGDKVKKPRRGDKDVEAIRSPSGKL